MTEKASNRKLVITVVFCILLLPVITVFTEEATVFLAFPLAFMMICIPSLAIAVFGNYGGIISMLILFGTMYFTGSKSLVYASLAIIPVCVVCGTCVKNKTPFYDGLLYTCAALLVGILLAYVIARLNIGGSIGNCTYEMLLNNSTNEEAGLILIYSLMLNVENGTAGVPAEAMQRFQDMVSKADYTVMRAEISAKETEIISFFDTLMPLLVAYVVILGGVLVFLAVRRRYAKLGYENAEAPKLKDFSIPKETSRALFIMFLASVFVPLLGFENTELFCIVLSEVTKLIFALQGIAMVKWFTELMFPGKASSIVTFIICIACGSSLGYVGMSECVFKMRENIKIIKKNNDGEDNRNDNNNNQ